MVLSSHDMEIRGAGELLGDEQSGQIQEIGFTLYTELLERAINAVSRMDKRKAVRRIKCRAD